MSVRMIASLAAPYWTFTATTLPSRSVARWTCPMDAAPTMETND